MCLLPPDKAKAREACFGKHTLSGRVVALRLRGLLSNQKDTRARMKFVHLLDRGRFLTRFMLSWNVYSQVVLEQPGTSRLLVTEWGWLRSPFKHRRTPKSASYCQLSFIHGVLAPTGLCVRASPSSVSRTRCAALCSLTEKLFFCKSLSALHVLPNRMNYIYGEVVLMFICYPLQC